MPDDLDIEPEAAPKPDRIAAFWLDYYAERGQIDTRHVMSAVKIAFQRDARTSPPLFAGDTDD
jgi:hypothetical protein